METDSLEKPLNLRERRTWYRWFYNSNPDVEFFIDFLSAVKYELNPKGIKKSIFSFYETMCRDLNLQTRIIQLAHEFYLMGNAYPYAEIEKIEKKHYVWKNILILPPNQIRVRKIPVSDQVEIE
jgi:hypothetical protein